MEIGYRSAPILDGWLSDLGSAIVHPGRAVKNLLTDVGTGIAAVKQGIGGVTPNPQAGQTQYLLDQPKPASTLTSWALPAGIAAAALGVFAVLK